MFATLKVHVHKVCSELYKDEGPVLLLTFTGNGKGLKRIIIVMANSI